MEVLKDISQLTKGCGVTFIKNDDFHYYEYLMVHPNRDTYFLFIDNWSQEVVRIYINDLLSGDYYVGKYDLIFVMEKRKDFFRRMIKNCDERIEELKSKQLWQNLTESNIRLVGYTISLQEIIVIFPRMARCT